MILLKKFKSIYKLLLILTFFSSSVLAEGFYGGLGYLKANHNTKEIPGVTYTNYDVKAGGYTIFGGYDFNERFGIEAGHNDLGETSVSVAGTARNTIVTVTTLAGVFKNPINEKFVLFAKAGLAYIDHDENIITSNGLRSHDETTNVYFGVGANVELSNGLIVRGLYEDYGKDDGQQTSAGRNVDQIDPNVMSLSLIKRF